MHRKTKVLMLLVAFGFLFWGFERLLLVHAPTVFSDSNEDLGYGWYIPLFSLYILWRERREVLSVAVDGVPSWGGLALMVPFLALGYLGVRGYQVRLEMLGFIGLLLTVAWAFYGRRLAMRILFPVLFLLFCLPLHSFLNGFTLQLRLLATAIAELVMKGCGVEVFRRGTMVACSGFSIDVADPCSGLRSIFALMALTAGYAYLTQRVWWKRWVLFASAVPLAVFGNSMRILTICLIGSCFSGDFAVGFYHDYSGYVVFLFAIAVMVSFGELLARGGRR